MNNLIFKKIWEDDSAIELGITGISDYVTAYQSCYVQDTALEKIAEEIMYYINNYKNEYYIQIGEKEGNSTPAFSMKFIMADSVGHVNIEVDIEIDDIDNRSHRCVFYISSELGALDRFGKQIKLLVNGEIGESAMMFEEIEDN